MAFSDIAKNIFWVLVILQFAPPLIKGIKNQYSDFFELKTKVGVISIKESLIKEASPYTKIIKKLFEDSSIKAIVLKMECPGGAPGASQTVFNELSHYKSLYPSKYIVAFVENVSASGGYYMMCPAHHIIASPSALIGSIGSYIQHPNFKEFIENYKIKYEIIKAGTYKGAGNPLLALTPEQRAQFQSVADDLYRQFIRDVASNRPHLAADSKVWADGKIFSGEQALALKLIDEVGSPATVVKVLKENAHIEGPIEWVKPAKRTGLFASWSEDTDEEPSYINQFINSFWNAFDQRYSTQARI